MLRLWYYVGTTSPTYKTSWRRYLSTSSPVLKDCDSRSGKYYTVFLELSSEGRAEVNSDISFRVEETSTKWAKNKGTVVWNQGRSTTGWKEWGLQSQSNVDLTFMYPDPSGQEWGGIIRKLQAHCPKDKSIIESVKGFSGDTISSNELNLSLAAEKDCQISFGYVECPINIGSQEKLKWKKGSEPKVIYKAF